ncbi:glucosaminidase domain-containing protein [Vibrio sp. CAU 1672]|uniref:glucosaminidase domain-containing protein n=1 Tax=Vibrio sp. CAU 1672 TaxID=3032594 RepID=UPI0023D97C41|nr:glucosaminidase domain-containing protein [Vibrio sp. CAU 1672]MDF2152193.1 glucosaminidase domain-containing protein [Vibrio sp. CAU 1672]
MRSSLKIMTLRATAILSAVAFSCIGPYLHYQRQSENLAMGEIAAEHSKHVDLSHLPWLGDIPDFNAIADTFTKKEAFFDFLRPKVALENRRIQKERAFLLAMQTDDMDNEQHQYASRLAKMYGYPLPNREVTEVWRSEMLKRVNVLPEALVLTQAANESAWGTSRFAIQANNLFGQWCYKKGCGIVPLQRSEGKAHEVRKFSSVQESVHRYFMNVNRNRAYEQLRGIRAQLEQQGDDLLSAASAAELTYGLQSYSERGMAYVNDLQAMIRHNNAFWTQ